MKPNEPTYQVVLDALALTTCYLAFLITAEVPVIYMHQFWDTAPIKDDRGNVLTVLLKVALSEAAQSKRSSQEKQEGFSHASCKWISKFLNLDNVPTADNKVASMMNVKVHQEESSTLAPPLLTVLVTDIPKTSTVAATTTPPIIHPSSSIPQMTTSTPVPTVEPTTSSIHALPKFSSLFGFDQRVSALEQELSQVKQSYTAEFEKKAQAEKEKYIDIIEKSVKEIIKDESTYKAVASLTEFELKKILLDKLVKSKSYRATEQHRDLYDTLRGRKDKDKDEDPPAGSDQGLKKKKTSKDDKPPKGSKLKESKSSSSKGSKSQHASYLYSKKLFNLERDDLFDLNVALRMFTRHVVILKQVEDLQLGVKSYQKKLNITRPETFRVLHDIASSLEMDYLPKRRCSKLDRKSKFLNLDNVPPADNEVASMMNVKVHQEESSTLASLLLTVPVTDIPKTSTLAATTTPPIIHPSSSIQQMTTSTPVPTVEPTTSSIHALPKFSSLFGFVQRVSALEQELSQVKQSYTAEFEKKAQAEKEKYIDIIEKSVKEIIKDESTYEAVASLTEFELKKILLDKLEKSKSYRATEQHRDLYDTLKKLFNLERDDLFDLNVALRMFTRRVVILKQVEDLQLGVKSYQKKLNITRPETFRVLHDIASSLEMDYLLKRRCSKLDRKRSHIMIKAVDHQLFEKTLMRNLEKFVGEREYENDFRLLEQII
nr:hypothetical protein [Tanacetum cinerariifolium]